MALARRSFLSGLALSEMFGSARAAESAPYIPHPANVSVLGTIASAIAIAQPIAQSFVHPPAFLARLPQASGTSLLMFDSALELDTDGFPGDSHNPNWQKDTSFRYADHSSLDANHVPYIVLPLPRSWPGHFGIALGDYAAIIREGRLTFGVFGDQGPSKKLGEASLELFRRLGQERLRPNGTVINAGTRPGIVTLVFPGSGAPEDRRDQQTLLRAIDVKGRALFITAGGKP